MEYLHRKVQDLISNTGFKYHNKCDKLKLIGLSFADDLLMFSRGDRNFVQMMMDKFHEFLRSTGLNVNPIKTNNILWRDEGRG